MFAVFFAISGFGMANVGAEELTSFVSPKNNPSGGYGPSPYIAKEALHGGPEVKRIPHEKWPGKKIQPDNSVWFIYNEREPIDGVEGLIPLWGTVSLFKWENKKILFNVGNDPDALINNAGVLGANLSGIDAVILDHMHFEHWEALAPVLDASPNAEIWCPPDLKTQLLERFPQAEDNLRFVGKSSAEWLTPNFMVYHDHSGRGLGGPMGIDEYHIALRTAEGLIVGIGCAHSGVIEAIESAVEKSGEKRIYLVFGGFCLCEPGAVQVKRIGFEYGYVIPSRSYDLRGKEAYIKQVVAQTKALGVKKIMTWMCSGGYAEEIFQEAYKENFIYQRLGLIMELPEPRK